MASNETPTKGNEMLEMTILSTLMFVILLVSGLLLEERWYQKAIEKQMRENDK